MKMFRMVFLFSFFANFLVVYSTFVDDDLRPVFYDNLIPDLELAETDFINASTTSPSLAFSSFTMQNDSLSLLRRSSSLRQSAHNDTKDETGVNEEEEEEEELIDSNFIATFKDCIHVDLEKGSNFVTDISNKNVKSKTVHKWGIEDKSDMSNFHTLVPNMAQKFEFELDDFQKRARRVIARNIRA